MYTPDKHPQNCPVTIANITTTYLGSVKQKKQCYSCTVWSRSKNKADLPSPTRVRG